MDLNHTEVLCGLGSSNKRKVLEWFLTWPCLCYMDDDEMTWKMRDRQRKMEIWRGREKRQMENKTKIGDRGRCRDNKEDVIPASLLQHPFSLYSLIFSFLLFVLPLIFSFYYSSSLFLSLSLVFISLSLSLSVVQTLKQMSHEIFAIKTQREFLWVCIYVCGWQAVHTHVYVCAHFRLWLWSLSGLLAALEGSPPVFDPTFVIQKIIWQAQNQIGC